MGRTVLGTVLYLALVPHGAIEPHGKERVDLPEPQLRRLRVGTVALPRQQRTGGGGGGVLARTCAVCVRLVMRRTLQQGAPLRFGPRAPAGGVVERVRGGECLDALTAPVRSNEADGCLLPERRVEVTACTRTSS